jgi:1,2-dihydroxy-3-keto-5-methylthiopentene dioxygenase
MTLLLIHCAATGSVPAAGEAAHGSVAAGDIPDSGVGGAESAGPGTAGSAAAGSAAPPFAPFPGQVHSTGGGEVRPAGSGPVGPAATGSGRVLLRSSDPAAIGAALAARGIGFERWPAATALAADASPEEILAAYAQEIERVQGRGNYPTVDAIRLTPDHPDRQALRRKFLAEHTHSEDEVRFFVEGRGLFCLHIGDEVLQLLCERNDWIAVPAGTRHWFDMGPEPRFCALRFFENPEGWVAQFTGDTIAESYPLLDGLLAEASG